MANATPVPYDPSQYAGGNVDAFTSGIQNQLANGSAVDPNLIGQQGTNHLDGFSKRYTPVGLQNIWSNPWMVLPDVFSGINMQGAGYQGLRNLNADPLSLYTMMAGKGNSMAGSNGTGDYANWLASLYNNLGTVGGRNFSAKELLQNLFNPGSNDGSSALQSVLSAGDAATQMRTLFNMAKDAVSVGMNPLAARGYEAALSNAGDSALNQIAKTNVGQGATNVPVYQLIKQIAPGLIPG